LLPLQMLLLSFRRRDMPPALAAAAIIMLPC